MSKLKLWNSHDDWEQAELEWEKGAKEAKAFKQLKSLHCLPQMPGITPETAKFLKWKSIKWMITKDHQWKIFKGFMRHPLKYGWQLVKSILKTRPYIRDDDFFLYGITSVEEFRHLLSDSNSLLIAGFSYCHKPFECPSGRFTDGCIHDFSHPVCRQCFIGKSVNALPEKRTIPLFIPTIHYIGEKIFEAVHDNQGKKIIFMITACEMTLQMFGDWGNMVNIQGIGVRLDGRVCNTMKAFQLSEEGIKPGLTVVLDETQKRMLNLIRFRRESVYGTTLGVNGTKDAIYNEKGC